MGHTRRAFVAGLAGSAASVAAGPRYAPILTAQMYVWEQHFSQRKQTLADGLDEALAATRRAGFQHLECGERLFAPAVIDGTAAMLRRHGMEAPVVSANKVFHEEEAARQGLTELLDLARAGNRLGVEAVNFNPMRKEQKALKTDAELAIQARYINRLAEGLRDLRMRLFLHQHDAEMRENAREWRHWLANTDPGLVRFCLDADWVVRGGQDPMALLEEAGGRLASLHVRSGRQGVWMEALGDGEPDYGRIAARLRKTGFTGYLVVELAYEQKMTLTRPLAENLRISREYAKSVFGV